MNWDGEWVSEGGGLCVGFVFGRLVSDLSQGRSMYPKFRLFGVLVGMDCSEVLYFRGVQVGYHCKFDSISKNEHNETSKQLVFSRCVIDPVSFASNSMCYPSQDLVHPYPYFIIPAPHPTEYPIITPPYPYTNHPEPLVIS